MALADQILSRPRTLAMADASTSDLVKAVLALMGVLGTAFLGAWATVRVGTKKEKAEIQTTLNQGFTGLIDQLRKQIDAQQETIDEQAKLIAEMRGQMRNLEQQVQSLEAFIDRAGLKPPAPKVLPFTPY